MGRPAWTAPESSWPEHTPTNCPFVKSRDLGGLRFTGRHAEYTSADGRTLWICYAHGWSCREANPPGSRYGMCLQEVQVLDKR